MLHLEITLGKQLGWLHGPEASPGKAALGTLPLCPPPTQFPSCIRGGLWKHKCP